MAECAAGRTVAEVATHVGVTRATVERWRRQPEFAAAIARYRFGWSRRRLRALALMAPDRPGPPLYLREVCGLLARAAACSRGRTARDVSPAHGGSKAPCRCSIMLFLCATSVVASGREGFDEHVLRVTSWVDP